MKDEDDEIVGGTNRPLQIAKVKEGGWNKERRATFLTVLAQTCNVSRACKATGMKNDPYALRRRDPAFARLWEEALAIGYERLEVMLLQRALKGVNAIDLDALLATGAEAAQEDWAQEDWGEEDGAQEDGGQEDWEEEDGAQEDGAQEEGAPEEEAQEEGAPEEEAPEPATVGDAPEAAAAPQTPAAEAVREERRPFGRAPGGLARDDVQLALSLLDRRRKGAAPLGGPRKVMTSEEVDALLEKKLDALARKLKGAA